jgi:hypothetical protein
MTTARVFLFSLFFKDYENSLALALILTLADPLTFTGKRFPRSKGPENNDKAITSTGM